MTHLEEIRLPHCDLTISRVGLGGCPLGGHGWGITDDRQAIAAVRRALDCGVNFFDTADIYGLGHSEELLAEALGPHRSRVVIASKFGVRRENNRTVRDASRNWLQRAVEASLRRLRIDCLPLYYVHWPDPAIPIAETIGALDRLRQTGKIRAIGVSNFTASQVAAACDTAPISAAQSQFSLIDQALARPLLDTLRRLNLPLITWGSLAQGLLSGKYHEEMRFEPRDRRRRYENYQAPKLQANLRIVAQLRHEAEALGMRPSQLAIRWLLDTPGVGSVLCGAKRPEQAAENSAAAGLPSLPSAVYQRLDTLAQNALNCGEEVAA